MADTILERFANTVVHYSLSLRPGDLFLIRSTTLAVPLVREVWRTALEAGAHVAPRISFDGQDDLFYRTASDEQLDWVSPLDRLEMEMIDARLTIHAPFNTRATAGTDPARIARHLRTQASLTAIHRH